MVMASGLETHVTLTRSCHVRLELVEVPPHEPQPREKVCRRPFHKLPELEAACGGGGLGTCVAGV